MFIFLIGFFGLFLSIPAMAQSVPRRGTCDVIGGGNVKVSELQCTVAKGVFTPDTPPASTIDASAKIDNPFKTGGNLVDLFKAILNNVVLPVGAVASVLAFVYSGFLYVKAQGNEAELKTAHKAILYTVIGTVILIGAAVIADVIGNTINQLR